MKDKSELGLLGGGGGHNDIRDRNYANDGEFVHVVDKSLTKLKEEIEKTPDKHLTIVVVKEPPASSTLPPRPGAPAKLPGQTVTRFGDRTNYFVADLCR